MKIKLLTPTPHLLTPIIEVAGDQVHHWWEGSTPDMAVSYNLRRILRPWELAVCPHINLHISLLPYNRGADPNFWSWFDHTPKGVSIHYMDAGVDTGPIVAQEGIDWAALNKATLATTYAALHSWMLTLFKEEWPRLRTLPLGQPQTGGEHAHPTHRSKDKDRFFKHLLLGWDTPVSVIEDMGAEYHAGATYWRKYNDEMLEQRLRGDMRCQAPE